MKKPPQHIGWKEVIGLPELGIIGLIAKIDTGAQTSALHVDAVARFTHSDGTSWVRFEIGHPRINGGQVHIYTAPLRDTRSIKSSNGKAELRHVIRTNLMIGARSKMVEITLTSRDNMRYPMLVGRNALRTGFLINPGRSFLLGKPELAAANSR